MGRKEIRRIGVISDTHGLLRNEAIEALRGSDLIIHAGDIGHAGDIRRAGDARGREIIDSLERIATVVAVRGNIDREEWAATLPESAVAEAGSVLIYVLHDLNALDLNAKAAGFRIVVSGHSHKPSRVEKDGVLYLNPGSAGPRRFRLPITLALIDLGQEPFSCEFVDLSQTRTEDK